MAFLLSEAANQTASASAKEAGENATLSPTDPLTSDPTMSDGKRFSELECA